MQHSNVPKNNSKTPPGSTPPTSALGHTSATPPPYIRHSFCTVPCLSFPPPSSAPLVAAAPLHRRPNRRTFSSTPENVDFH
ncbi:unnamed protein product [Chondrus crispus]|uniref:Uncharacterized protein n=1 Tax=Chondrus crispus TaxID=2769 RepID=R7Q382_CHOCR|nr:unnamed protein product [Chondrus crispus]CDF32987.1 unnamed protein product [Chondrus crispus]|eukprot:XP_005712790.1 unnamed protein product [Chondrus crispus]